MIAPTGNAHDDLNVVVAEKNRQMIPTTNMNIELMTYLRSRLRPLFLNDILVPPNDIIVIRSES